MGNFFNKFFPHKSNEEPEKIEEETSEVVSELREAQYALYLFIIITFIGYSVPLIILIGWFPDDGVLWYVVAENLFIFSIGWVIYFMLFKRDAAGKQLERNVYIKKCRETNIVILFECMLFMMETTAIVLLGVLAERYKDVPEARAEYTIIPSIIFKIIQITGIHSCILKMSKKNQSNEIETGNPSFKQPPMIQREEQMTHKQRSVKQKSNVKFTKVKNPRIEKKTKTAPFSIGNAM